MFVKQINPDRACTELDAFIDVWIKHGIIRDRKEITVSLDDRYEQEGMIYAVLTDRSKDAELARTAILHDRKMAMTKSIPVHVKKETRIKVHIHNDFANLPRCDQCETRRLAYACVEHKKNKKEHYCDLCLYENKLCGFVLDGRKAELFIVLDRKDAESYIHHISYKDLQDTALSARHDLELDEARRDLEASRKPRDEK